MTSKAPKAPAPATPAETRETLLAAATAVFSEIGYRSATIRDICRRAGANVAAVNYHFGDKASLYREALRHVHAQADERHPVPHSGSASLKPRQRLEQFVRSLLFRLLDPGPYALSSRLMSREMMEPTVALDTVVQEYVHPVADEVRAIAAGFLGPKASEEQIRLCGMSIVSQCLFYHQCGPVIRKLFPDMEFKTGGIDRLAAHITQFCVAGLRQTAKEAAKR